MVSLKHVIICSLLKRVLDEWRDRVANDIFVSIVQPEVLTSIGYIACVAMFSEVHFLAKSYSQYFTTVFDRIILLRATVVEARLTDLLNGKKNEL